MEIVLKSLIEEKLSNVLLRPEWNDVSQEQNTLHPHSVIISTIGMKRAMILSSK